MFCEKRKTKKKKKKSSRANGSTPQTRHRTLRIVVVIVVVIFVVDFINCTLGALVINHETLRINNSAENSIFVSQRRRRGKTISILTSSSSIRVDIHVYADLIQKKNACTRVLDVFLTLNKLFFVFFNSYHYFICVQCLLR